MYTCRQQEGSLDRLRGELRNLEQRSRESLKEFETCKQAVSRHEKDAKDLRNAINRAEKMVEEVQDRLDKATIDEGHLDALKADLKDATENKHLQESSYQEAVIAKDKMQEKLKIEHQKLKDTEENIMEATKEWHDLGPAHSKLTKHRETALREKNTAFHKLEQAQQQTTSDQAARQEQMETIKNYSELAGQVGPRIEIPAGETFDALERKLAKFHKDVARMDKE